MGPIRIPILDPKSLSEFVTWKEEILNVSPTFNIGSNTRQANELLIESFVKEGSSPWCCPLQGTSWISLLECNILNFACNKPPSLYSFCHAIFQSHFHFHW